MPWSISEEDYAKRLDLREYNVCSIDPPGVFVCVYIFIAILFIYLFFRGYPPLAGL